jgi:hypothetical protein
MSLALRIVFEKFKKLLKEVVGYGFYIYRYVTKDTKLFLLLHYAWKQAKEY